MKKRLSKIARDLNANVSDVAEFLRLNGYDCQEDPNETFESDVVEIISNNLPAFLNRKEREQDRTGKKKEKVVSEDVKEIVPVELRIVEAASREMKLIERMIGFTDYDWSFSIARYRGECLQPVEFTLFDEVICGLLLIEKMSLKQIGIALGFDVQRDLAEKQILTNAIKDLRDDKMLEGDEDLMWLTDTGIEYAKNGVKFSTFRRKFELYFDEIGGTNSNAKNIFSSLKSEKRSATANNIPSSLDEIRILAEHQAPEVHFPNKNYQLQDTEFLGSESFNAKVWVVLLENFRDKSLRTLVYDEKQDKIIEELSESLDKQDQIKATLLDKLVKLDDAIELTKEDKKPEQIQFETSLIDKQKELEKAIEQQDGEQLKRIQREVVEIKRHFNSLEFEVELKRLFDETANDLWIISPWIKNATFKRIPFFEKYLKKGGRIFVAYSEPEAEGQVMAYEEPLGKLLELEKKYQNFYLHQLPAFHYKNVWLRNESHNDTYYTGSYNILSFFVSQGLQNVRQEKMTRVDWNQEVQKEYEDVIRLFGLKYANKAIEDFNHLCQNHPEKLDKNFIQKIKTVDYSKLKPFINQGISEFDKVYRELNETKEQNLNIFRKKFFEQKIEEFRTQAENLGKQPVSHDRKKHLLGEFENLRDEFIDFMDLQFGAAKDVATMIENLRIAPINNQGKRRY